MANLSSSSSPAAAAAAAANAIDTAVQNVMLHQLTIGAR
jgi:hypothetical protein